MTKTNLLEQLREFTREAVKGLVLPVAMQEEDGQKPAPRPAAVYLMDLPEFRDATRKAPYILHQVLTGKDIQAEGLARPEATAVVRTVFCVYHEDRQEGALSLLRLMERLRIDFLKQPLLGKQFKLDLKTGLESLVYPSEEPRPYYIGEMISAWKLPGIQNEQAAALLSGGVPHGKRG